MFVSSAFVILHYVFQNKVAIFSDNLFWVWTFMHVKEGPEWNKLQGSIQSQTWERKTLSSHCWGGRSITRTAPVAKWIKPKSWMRDKVYPLEILSSYGYWCCLAVNISLYSDEHFSFWKSWLFLFCVVVGTFGVFVSAMFANATVLATN